MIALSIARYILSIDDSSLDRTEADPMEDNKRYLKPWQYFTFGSGNAGMVFSNNFITAFIIAFIAKTYLDLDIAIIGTLMLVAKLLDGVTDFIFGAIMDRCHSKIGKARPWVLRGAVPLGLFGVLMFCIPDVGGWIPYAWFFLFYLMYNAVAYTVVSLSYNAMNALITRSDSERVRISVVSFTVVLIANMLINSLTLGAVEALGNTAAAWRTVMIVFTALGTILILLSAITVKELPAEESENVFKSETVRTATLSEDLRRIFKNPYFIWSILYAVIVNMVLTSNLSLSLYYSEINLGDINIYSTLSVVALLACLPGLFFAPFFVKKLGIYRCNLTMSLAMFMLILLSLSLAFSKPVNVTAFFIIFSMRFLPFGVMLASVAPIVPSIVRYSYLQSGRHLEGLLFSSSSIGGKISSGIAAALPGWLLSGIGYTASTATQTAATVSGMNFWFYALPVISGAAIVVIFSQLNVDKGIKELEAR